jgi:hypothetical protein
MRMQVRETGDDVLIEIHGIAGHHRDVLQVLSGDALGRTAGATQGPAPDLTIRAGADVIYVRLHGRAAHPVEALTVYHALRQRLLGRHAVAPADVSIAMASPAGAPVTG